MTSAGLHFREVSTMGLAMDIDAPGDLQLLQTGCAARHLPAAGGSVTEQFV